MNIQRRFRYTALEERRMIAFLASELRAQNCAARRKGPRIWEIYVLSQQTQKKPLGLESHFRRQMLTKMEEFCNEVSPEDFFLLLRVFKVKLRRYQIRKIEKALRCTIQMTADGCFDSAKLIENETLYPLETDMTLAMSQETGSSDSQREEDRESTKNSTGEVESNDEQTEWEEDDNETLTENFNQHTRIDDNEKIYRMRVCMLYDYRRGLSVDECHGALCEVFANDGVVSKMACARWFKRFRSGNESLDCHVHIADIVHHNEDDVRPRKRFSDDRANNTPTTTNSTAVDNQTKRKRVEVDSETTNDNANNNVANNATVVQKTSMLAENTQQLRNTILAPASTQIPEILEKMKQALFSMPSTLYAQREERDENVNDCVESPRLQFANQQLPHRSPSPNTSRRTLDDDPPLATSTPLLQRSKSASAQEAKKKNRSEKSMDSSRHSASNPPEMSHAQMESSRDDVMQLRNSIATVFNLREESGDTLYRNQTLHVNNNTHAMRTPLSPANNSPSTRPNAMTWPERLCSSASRRSSGNSVITSTERTVLCKKIFDIFAGDPIARLPPKQKLAKAKVLNSSLGSFLERNPEKLRATVSGLKWILSA